jgi:Ca-activated chloride channel family protein
MPQFAIPLAFLLLLPWALAAWFLYRRNRKPAGILFAPTHRLPLQASGWRATMANAVPVIFLIGTLLLIIAAARPRTFLAREQVNINAMAIMMTVDISGSMQAIDLSERTPTGINEQTRLDVVKTTFASFIEKRPDDLLGLVTFGGFAATRSPLTADHRALLHVLKGVEIPTSQTDEFGRPVSQEELLTAIGDGLATACARLVDAEPKTRIVVLLSDGESNAGIITPDVAAETAKKLGIKVYTICIGTTGKALFRTRDIVGRSVLGQAYVQVDEAQLKRIADVTGGLYFNVRDPNGLRNALTEIDRLETTRIERQSYNRYNEKFKIPLIAGSLLVCLALTLNMQIVRRLL